MTTLRKSIGILGGSFNPVHNGHISIAESFLQSELIDELWVLLTPEPPHKSNQVKTVYKLRLKMLKAAFEGIKNIKISDLEQQLPQPSYTIQTLQHLRSEYPNNTFYLCIGEDSLRDFKQWKDWRKILDYCDLLIAQRPSVDNNSLDSTLKKNVHFVDHEPIRVSSTKIRNAVAKGEDISELVPASVKKIINKENLYRKED